MRGVVVVRLFEFGIGRAGGSYTGGRDHGVWNLLVCVGGRVVSTEIDVSLTFGCVSSTSSTSGKF